VALAAHAQVSLAELKEYLGETGSGEDANLERAIMRASGLVEAEGVGGRRLIYRGPVEDDDNIVASAAIADGALTVAASPNSAGRTLVVTKTDADRSVTAATLTMTGTVGGTAGETEAFDLSLADVQHGVKFFTAVSAAAITVTAGAQAIDTVKVGTSEGYTELFSPSGTGILICPVEWPIQNVINVNEDADRVFAAATDLVEDTDFEIRNRSSIRRALARIDDSLDFAWIAGRRVIRVRYSAGYKTSAAVPEQIKGVCLELAAWYHQHTTRKEFGLSTRSDGIGSVTRSGPPMLTTGMRAALGSYWRAEAGITAERDFDLEVA
jgi:hypothetical protein